MVTATDVLFSVLPPALGNKTSMALTVTNVDVNIKNINNKKTISVIDDILKFGLTLFLPRKFIIPVRLINLKTQQILLPFDKQPYRYELLNGYKLYML
ncbi:hypothetical protein KUL118_62580 [Tenacibaculum sp. KUL118]|nr:hypothetical protein KUL118_62580 [Tenacibaculum sp. KUL118]